MSDELEGTRWGGPPGEYDGDQNRIAIFNGYNLDEPAIGFSPYAPDPKDVTLESIAHSLSQTCRFGGHTVKFWSVASHSLYVWAHVPPEYGLYAILHDASEAYMTDIPSPYKMLIPGYKETEAKVQQAIGEHFGVPDLDKLPEEVKAADYRALGHEAYSLMPRHGSWYGEYYRAALKAAEGYGGQVLEDMSADEAMTFALDSEHEFAAVVKFELAMQRGKPLIGAADLEYIRYIHDKYRQWD